MFGGYAFQTAGIARTTPSKAAFITGFSVVLVPVFLGARVAQKNQRLGLGRRLGISFAGFIFSRFRSQGISDLNRGDLLVMGCAVLYAFQIIYISRYSADVFARRTEFPAGGRNGVALPDGGAAC